MALLDFVKKFTGQFAAGSAETPLLDRLQPNVPLPPASSSSEPLASGEPQGEKGVGDLVQQMLAEGRYALLLRAQIVANLSADQQHRAWDTLQDHMALVPEGEVILGRSGNPYRLDEMEENSKQSKPVPIVVDYFYLDRYPVTNRQYQAFVNAGGYEQMALWDQEIWAGVLDFVDRTGHPGPRNWKQGRFLPGEEDLPVIEVSWYEAGAFSRWVGKRLPTDAEWEKAGCWPVSLGSGVHSQRKFPWGDTMDRARCNISGSGFRGLVSVKEFPDGVSVGGIYQLIGNVWEWTTGDFGKGPYQDRSYTLPVPMKSIRGGAYDTYFENQSTCQFRSGENPMARKHNIGFRCALSVCDLPNGGLPADLYQEEPEETEDEPSPGT